MFKSFKKCRVANPEFSVFAQLFALRVICYPAKAKATEIMATELKILVYFFCGVSISVALKLFDNANVSDHSR